MHIAFPVLFIAAAAIATPHAIRLRRMRNMYFQYQMTIVVVCLGAAVLTYLVL